MREGGIRSGVGLEGKRVEAVARYGDHADAEPGRALLDRPNDFVGLSDVAKVG